MYRASVSMAPTSKSTTTNRSLSWLRQRCWRATMRSLSASVMAGATTARGSIVTTTRMTACRISIRISNPTTRIPRSRCSISPTSKGDLPYRSRRPMIGRWCRPAGNPRMSKPQSRRGPGCSLRRRRYQPMSCHCMPGLIPYGRTVISAFRCGCLHVDRWPSSLHRIQACGLSTLAPDSTTSKSITASTIPTVSTISCSCPISMRERWKMRLQ